MGEGQRAPCLVSELWWRRWIWSCWSLQAAEAPAGAAQMLDWGGCSVGLLLNLSFGWRVHVNPVWGEWVLLGVLVLWCTKVLKSSCVFILQRIQRVYFWMIRWFICGLLNLFLSFLEIKHHFHCKHSLCSLCDSLRIHQFKYPIE